MTPENLPVDYLHIRLLGFELNAVGTFAVSTVAILIIMWLVATTLARRR